MKSVYVTRRLPDQIMQPLYERFSVDIWADDRPVPRDVLLGSVTHAEGLLCMLTDTIDETVLEAAPALEVVSQMAVGVDNIDVEACARRDIVIGHTPGVLTETVADTAHALLGSIVRRLPEGEKAVRRGEWGPWSPTFLNGRDLYGTTLGIIGMGRIGHAVARRAQGFEMDVVYSSPRASDDTAARRVGQDELLEQADHVILSVSLNEDTHHLIGGRQLDTMKPSAYLVNVSRGPVVDTDALVDALSRHSIAGAALDVTDPEPLPPDHPLLDLPNCLVVPHIASASLATREAMARLAVDNLVAGLRGEMLPARHMA